MAICFYATYTTFEEFKEVALIRLARDYLLKERFCVTHAFFLIMGHQADHLWLRLQCDHRL